MLSSSQSLLQLRSRDSAKKSGEFLDFCRHARQICVQFSSHYALPGENVIVRILYYPQKRVESALVFYVFVCELRRMCV